MKQKDIYDDFRVKKSFSLLVDIKIFQRFKG